MKRRLIQKWRKDPVYMCPVSHRCLRSDKARNQRFDEKHVEKPKILVAKSLVEFYREPDYMRVSTRKVQQMSDSRRVRLQLD